MKSELVGGPQEIEDDARSDVSELSRRTDSMLSDMGGLDPNDRPSSPQPGKLTGDVSLVLLMLKLMLLVVTFFCRFCKVGVLFIYLFNDLANKGM